MLEETADRPIAEAPAAEVSGFLDGVQRSRMVAHVRGVPIVYATVAAAVRARRARRLETWRAPRLQRSLFASREGLGEAAWEVLAQSGLPAMDTTRDLSAAGVPTHPHMLRARALDMVALEREKLERQLAADWCRAEPRWLWIDGGIAGNLAVDDRASAFGVVKSHATMYGTAAQVRAVLALGEGERSPAFLVGHRPRRAVASWYLRLRVVRGGDPLHGLVRVEVAPPTTLARALESVDANAGIAALEATVREEFVARVDRISGMILAERAPLSLPDPRWDTLTYGIHACERYLDALVGTS